MLNSNFILSFLISFLIFIFFFLGESLATRDIATGSTTGYYYKIAKKIVNSLKGEFNSEAIETEGSVENLNLLNRGVCELAIVQSDILYRSYHGEKKEKVNTNVNIVIRKSSKNITSIIDLKNKKVSLGKKDSDLYKNSIYILNSEKLDVHEEKWGNNYSDEEALKKLSQKEIDAAFITFDSNIVNNKSFKSEMKLLLLPKIPQIKDIRAIISLFPEYIQIVVRKNSNIYRVLDLYGKNVSLGKKDSGTFRNSIHVLNASGLSENDVVSFTSFDHQKSIEKLMNKCKESNKYEIDAAFITSASIILNEKKDYRDKLKIISLKKSAIDEIIKKYPYYSYKSVEIIEQSIYKPRVLYVRAVLVTKKNFLTKEDASLITKNLYNNWKELGIELNIELLANKSIARKINVPLHPGAEEFYIEKGLIYTFRDYYILFFIFLFIGLIVLLRKIIGERLEVITASNQFFERSLNILDVITSKKIAMVVWGIAFIFSVDILLIKKMEASYSFLHDVSSPFEDLSFGETLLWLIIYASTGYTQSIFPISNLGKIFSIVIPFMGIGGILFGIIMFANRQFQIRDLEKRGLRVRYLKNHIVICGWNTRVPGIIYALTSPHVPIKKKIVVVAEMDDDYPLQDYQFKSNLVFYCRGYSSSYETLKKINLQNADKLIVMAGQKKLSNENRRSILTILAAKSYYKEFNKEKALPMFAELIFDNNKTYFEMADVDKLISLDIIREKYISSAIINNGLTGLLLDILTHNERNDLYSIYVRDLKEPLKDEIRGKTFIEILVYLRQKKDVLLLAIYKQTEVKHRAVETTFRNVSPYIINPSTNEEKNYKVDLNDKLIYLSQAKNTIQR